MKFTPQILPSLVLPFLSGPQLASAADVEVEVVASFNPALAQTPEGVTTDLFGNQYVSLALTGELVKVDAQGNMSTVATLPVSAYPGEPCFGFVGFMGVLIYTPLGIYVNVNSCDPANRGVWRVSPNGAFSPELVTQVPPEATLNGIDFRYANASLYVTDPFAGKIYRFPVLEPGVYEVWSDDPSLAVVPNPVGAPGANGLQFFGSPILGNQELYVANSSSNEIVALGVDLDGDWDGTKRIHATVPFGCDDFAIDLEGTIYCTTDPFNTVEIIYSDGTVDPEPLLTIEDGVLDGPTDATFGRLGDRFSLYISNAAFPFFPNQGMPSLLRVEMDVPGAP